jgi:hypothetical protein
LTCKNNRLLLLRSIQSIGNLSGLFHFNSSTEARRGWNFDTSLAPIPVAWRAANEMYFAPNSALIYGMKKFDLRKQPLAAASVNSIHWKIYPVYSILILQQGKWAADRILTLLGTVQIVLVALIAPARQVVLRLRPVSPSMLRRLMLRRH